MHRPTARAIWAVGIGFILLVSVFSVGVLGSLTATWTTAEDFRAGILRDLDATSSPGQLRLTNVASAWVKSSSNPVLGPGVGWESDWVDAPSILYENGVYKMWYQGCVGTHCDIGYATSPDGINWTRSLSNPVLRSNATGWDQTLGNPSVIHDGSGYHMWYAGDGPLAIQIGYASSADGIVWNKFEGAPVFKGTEPWDAGSTSTPVVIKDGSTFVLYFSGHPGNYAYSLGRATSLNGINWTEDPGNPLMVPEFPWEESRVHPTAVGTNGSGYELYYTGGFNAPQIGHATSADGRIWRKDATNPAVSLGPSGSWDRAGVAVAKVVKAGGSYRMYYGGESTPWAWRIGVADYSPGTNSPAYRGPGFFITGIVDSGSPNTTWDDLDWSGSLPSETGIGVNVRVGNTPIPDPSWTTLPAPVTTPGLSPLGLPKARFAQVGAALVTLNVSKTPALDSISLRFSPPGVPQSLFSFSTLGVILIALIVPVGIVLGIVLVLATRPRSALPPSWIPGYTFCSACRAANPMTNRFCPNCGQPLGGPPR